MLRFVLLIVGEIFYSFWPVVFDVYSGGKTTIAAIVQEYMELNRGNEWIVHLLHMCSTNGGLNVTNLEKRTVSDLFSFWAISKR